MRIVLRATLAGAAVALLASACARDTTPTAAVSDLSLLAPDPSVGATSGQASLPGFTMSGDLTYQGSLDASSSCSWSATDGRVECAPVSRNGLTITRSYAFYTVAGTAQPARDSLTRSVNTQVSVKGTTTTPRGAMTVDRSSSVTVSGLARDAATHTLNGTETGTTSGTVTTDQGASATVNEVFSSITANVVVPKPFSATSWPLSGTTTRSSTLTVTRSGATRSSVATEQATYNGTSVIPVVLTRDGKSRTCSRDLAAHTTTCR